LANPALVSQRKCPDSYFFGYKLMKCKDLNKRKKKTTPQGNGLFFLHKKMQSDKKYSCQAPFPQWETQPFPIIPYGFKLIA